MADEVLLGVGGIQFLCVCSLEVPGGRTAELHPLPLALPVVWTIICWVTMTA